MAAYHPRANNDHPALAHINRSIIIPDYLTPPATNQPVASPETATMHEP